MYYGTNEFGEVVFSDRLDSLADCNGVRELDDTIEFKKINMLCFCKINNTWLRLNTSGYKITKE